MGRLAMLQVVEMRNDSWSSNEVMDKFYTDRFKHLGSGIEKPPKRYSEDSGFRSSESSPTNVKRGPPTAYGDVCKVDDVKKTAASGDGRAGGGVKAEVEADSCTEMALVFEGVELHLGSKDK